MRMLRGAVGVVVVAACLLIPAAALAAGPPVVVEESVLDVSATSATLQARIEPPSGEASTFRFEYDTSAYVSSGGHGQGRVDSKTEMSLSMASAAARACSRTMWERS